MKRFQLPCFALAACVLISSGCVRQDPTSTVPRGDHALVIDLGQDHSHTSRSNSGSTPQSAQYSGAQAGPVAAGETTIILGEGESLYQVADQRGISLRWLIERNDFTRRPGPGDRVIIPASAAYQQ